MSRPKSSLGVLGYMLSVHFSSRLFVQLCALASCNYDKRTTESSVIIIVVIVVITINIMKLYPVSHLFGERNRTQWPGDQNLIGRGVLMMQNQWDTRLA